MSCSFRLCYFASLLLRVFATLRLCLNSAAANETISRKDAKYAKKVRKDAQQKISNGGSSER